jgi:hypothetical protein
MNKRYLYSIYLMVSVILFPLLLNAQNPSYLLELRNDVQVADTVYEFDIYLVRTGATELEYASGSYGIVINPSIKDGGTLTAKIVSDSPDPVLVASNQNPVSVSFFDASDVIRVAARTPPGAGNGALISNVAPGTRLCRIRLSSTVPFAQYQPNLTWTTTTLWPTQVYAYVGGTNTAITNYSNHTTDNLDNPVLNVVTSSEDIYYDDFEVKIYPNPLSERATIYYRLMHDMHVSLSVIDLGGRVVEQLINDFQDAGSYSLQWIPASLPEGIYIIKIQTGVTQKTTGVTIIR